MMTMLAGVLTTSLLGSAHCAGMCGPLLSLYSGQSDRVRPHFAYHLCRWAAYVVMGGIAGAVGLGVDQAGSRIGLANAAVLGAAMFLIVFGTVRLLEAFHWVPQIRALRAAQGALNKFVLPLLRWSGARSPWLRASALGLGSALLPCGWLYAYVVTAGATGNPLYGALVMSAFWMGTVPALAAVGFGAQQLLGPLRRHAPVMTALSLIVVGALTVWQRLPTSAAKDTGADCHHHASLSTNPEQ